jgi:hypothetical protein
MQEEPSGMIRTIHILSLTGLIALALSAVLYSALILDVSTEGAYAFQAVLRTSLLLSFSAGLLTLTLTIPRRQRPWSAALLVSLLLNGYGPFTSFSNVWFRLLAPLVTVPYVVQFLVFALVPSTPALLALGYAIRAASPARPAPQPPQTVEEGSLDITIEPMESEPA